jgi:hypothetical protein
MKIILSESQLNKLNEQLGGLLRFASHETTTGSGWDMMSPYPNSKQFNKKFTDKEQVINLFNSLNSWKTSPQDWIAIKPIADKMYQEMKGLGSGSFLEELKKIKTINQLAAIIKNWRYDNETFVEWLSGELTITWSQILNILKVNFGKYINSSSSGLQS